MSAKINEISKGVFLHKQQVKEDDELMYLFKIEVNRMNMVEFVADFTGSENVEQEGKQNLISQCTIEPYVVTVVAKLILHKDWKLKSKFKVLLKAPSKEIQEKYLAPHLDEMERIIHNNSSILKDQPVSIMSLSNIQQQLIQHNINFVDPEFVPNDESIYSDYVDTTNFDSLVHWRRPKDFMEVDYDADLKEPAVFYDAIDPTDIRQGCLGDCWFISSLSTLAERPSLVERLFVTKETNQHGIYRVKLCKNGEWVTVTVDDYFPCFPLGEPLFSKGQGNELWPQIIEKAYAKLHGNYFNLRGGWASEALTDLTGCPTKSNSIEEMSYDDIWRKLIEGYEEGYLINASTQGEDRYFLFYNFNKVG